MSKKKTRVIEGESLEHTESGKKERQVVDVTSKMQALYGDPIQKAVDITSWSDKPLKGTQYVLVYKKSGDFNSVQFVDTDPQYTHKQTHVGYALSDEGRIRDEDLFFNVRRWNIWSVDLRELIQMHRPLR